MYICIYIYIYIYTCICMYINICIYMCIYYIYVHIHIYIYVCCIRIHIYSHRYIYIYIYIHIYIHMHTPPYTCPYHIFTLACLIPGSSLPYRVVKTRTVFKLHVTFPKLANKHRALFRTMTCKIEPSATHYNNFSYSHFPQKIISG